MTPVLARLVLPLPASLVLLVLGGLALVAGRRRAAMACIGAAALLLASASSLRVAERVAAPLEASHAAPPLASLEPADAILVLGGGILPALPPREHPEVAPAGDRVLHAGRLYRAGKAPWIVVSGGPGRADRPGESEGMAALLVELGVPDEAILREERSTNTRENCTYAKAILDAHGARDVLLVTSAIHMRRAYAACQRAGLDVRAAPTDFWVAGGGTRGWRAWVPRPEGLVLSHAVMHEVFGYWVYERRGWIDR